MIDVVEAYDRTPLASTGDRCYYQPISPRLRKPALTGLTGRLRRGKPERRAGVARCLSVTGPRSGRCYCLRENLTED
jgi:hypothetical protein